MPLYGELDARPPSFVILSGAKASFTSRSAVEEPPRRRCTGQAAAGERASYSWGWKGGGRRCGQLFRLQRERASKALDHCLPIAYRWLAEQPHRRIPWSRVALQPPAP